MNAVECTKRRGWRPQVGLHGTVVLDVVPSPLSCTRGAEVSADTREHGDPLNAGVVNGVGDEVGAVLCWRPRVMPTQAEEVAPLLAHQRVRG